MPRRQRRWVCCDCSREWIYRTQGPEGNCPICGSPEVASIEFDGLFDSTTPPEAIACAAAPDMPVPAGKPSDVIEPPMTLLHQDDHEPNAIPGVCLT